jgi:Purine nucleoside phosphorylase
LRAVLAQAARRSGLEPVTEAVYAQTIGPRYETPAEVRLLAQFAEIVGMTMANEADCAAELGLPYAAVCAIDNWANGIDETPLAHDDLLTRQVETIAAVETLLLAAVEELTA